MTVKSLRIYKEGLQWEGQNKKLHIKNSISFIATNNYTIRAKTICKYSLDLIYLL